MSLNGKTVAIDNFRRFLSGKNASIKLTGEKVVIVSIRLFNSTILGVSLSICNSCVLLKMSSASTVVSAQQMEIEDTIKRIQTHKGVQGFIIASNDSKSSLSTNFDNFVEFEIFLLREFRSFEHRQFNDDVFSRSYSKAFG